GPAAASGHRFPALPRGGRRAGAGGHVPRGRAPGPARRPRPPPPRSRARARAVRSEPDPPPTAPGRDPAGGGAWRPPRAHRLAGAAVVPGPERGAWALRPVAVAARAARGRAEARMRRSRLIPLAASAVPIALPAM